MFDMARTDDEIAEAYASHLEHFNERGGESPLLLNSTLPPLALAKAIRERANPLFEAHIGMIREIAAQENVDPIELLNSY